MNHLQQAETKLDNFLKSDSVMPIVRDIVEHLKEQKHYGFYQLCPKCDGQKKVSYPPWLPAGLDSFSASETEWPCGICKGEGVLARPGVK